MSYEIQVSARARRVTLHILAGRGLVVTVPRRFPKRDIPAIVEENRAWVLESLAQLRARTPAKYLVWPPARLDLNAMNTRVFLDYCHPDGSDSAVVDSTEASRWVLAVDTENRPLVAQALASVLKYVARDVLLPLLRELAVRHGLTYQRASIRGQRTLWGSYSSTGTLSLNYKLLFLQAELVEYVLLHELAHTRYLDHSAKFWRLLVELLPDAVALDRRLRDAGDDVPPWLELAR
ncbi:MAG: SprT family zinc-dependent metalloprotease [Granulosicoccus sp.]